MTMSLNVSMTMSLNVSFSELGASSTDICETCLCMRLCKLLAWSRLWAALPFKILDGWCVP